MLRIVIVHQLMFVIIQRFAVDIELNIKLRLNSVMLKLFKYKYILDAGV